MNKTASGKATTKKKKSLDDWLFCTKTTGTTSVNGLRQY